MVINARYVFYAAFAMLSTALPIVMLVQSLRRERFGFVQFDESGIIRQDWSTCMQLNAAKMDNSTWIQWPTIIQYCEKYLTDNITTYGAYIGQLPMRFTFEKSHDFVPIILYLAEGMTEEDIENARKGLKWSNITFIGTEPVATGNYTDVGVFFPETDDREEEVNWHREEFPKPQRSTKRRAGRKEFTEFMVTYGLKFYDGIWLDWAAKDYEILPLTYRGDVLDELEITVCQFNVMIHYGTRMQEIHEFIERTVKEKRYAILKPLPPGTSINSEKFPFAVPLTLYMINMENQECLKRYTPQLI